MLEDIIERLKKAEEALLGYDALKAKVEKLEAEASAQHDRIEKLEAEAGVYGAKVEKLEAEAAAQGAVIAKLRKWVSDAAAGKFNPTL